MKHATSRNLLLADGIVAAGFGLPAASQEPQKHAYCTR